MGRRSHRVSEAEIENVNKAFDRYGKTQECLGGLAGCTRQTVIKFLAGRPVDKQLFQTLCDTLNLKWKEIAELESEENETSKTTGSMNRASNPFGSRIEGTTSIGLVEEQDSTKTIVTYITKDGKFVVTIPGDLNRFLQNTEEQNIWLEAVKRTSGDKNAEIYKIEKGSIKIIFNVSPDGIKKLEEEQDKISLVARIIRRAKGEELDLSDTNLSGTDLRGIDLSGIDLSCADLSNANLENANLENADLNCADVSGANLSGANLSNTDFSDAIVENAVFSNNLGISSELKQDLINRGARLENSPAEDNTPQPVKSLNNKNNPISFRLVFSNLIRGNLGGAFRIFQILSSADLNGADLSGAYLIRANLRGADLIRANLRGADLSGAYLSRANLSGADLIRANLRGADLIRANLSGADLIDANLRGAYLRGANLRGADLIRANLSSADLSGADLIDANLRVADLIDANLRGAYLRGADLIDANLRGAYLRGADLIDANLRGADLIDANLRGAYLIRANLRGADLIRANLRGADLIRANLSSADLSGADLIDANLRGAYLRGANLIDVTVKNAQFGDNLGITEDIKRELKQRGAIFKDSPNDRRTYANL